MALVFSIIVWAGDKILILYWSTFIDLVLSNLMEHSRMVLWPRSLIDIDLFFFLFILCQRLSVGMVAKLNLHNIQLLCHQSPTTSQLAYILLLPYNHPIDSRELIVTFYHRDDNQYSWNECLVGARFFLFSQLYPWCIWASCTYCQYSKILACCKVSWFILQEFFFFQINFAINF